MTAGTGGGSEEERVCRDIKTTLLTLVLVASLAAATSVYYCISNYKD